MKTNYDIKFNEQINQIQGQKPKLLLHSCCGPCSSASLEKLQQFFDITIVFYNPNIYPKQEFEKRLFEQQKLLKKAFDKISILQTQYDENEFLEKTKGLENEKEGGARCSVCFLLRLEKTAQLAKQNGFDYFGTTLTISPHKNEQIINMLGENISKKYDVKFLYSDLKKHDGYKRSIELSKIYDIYRQHYCGCRFSIQGDTVEI